MLRDTQRYLYMTTELLQQASLCFERYVGRAVTQIARWKKARVFGLVRPDQKTEADQAVIQQGDSLASGKTDVRLQRVRTGGGQSRLAA